MKSTSFYFFYLEEGETASILYLITCLYKFNIHFNDHFSKVHVRINYESTYMNLLFAKLSFKEQSFL